MGGVGASAVPGALSRRFGRWGILRGEIEGMIGVGVVEGCGCRSGHWGLEVLVVVEERSWVARIGLVGWSVPCWCLEEEERRRGVRLGRGKVEHSPVVRWRDVCQKDWWCLREEHRGERSQRLDIKDCWKSLMCCIGRSD